VTCSDPAVADLVSIVIPVFNGAKYVGRAIDSALAQTWSHIEVIVVDDGSDDGGATQRILARYGTAIRVISKTNGGVASALNAGIAAMRGSWFSWLSHDDLYYPRKTERYLEVLRKLPEPAIAFGDVDIVDEHDRWQRRVELTRGFQGTDGRWAVLEGRLNGCAMLIPRSCLEACGMFDPGLPTTQDCAYWFQLAQRFPFIAIDEVLVGFRQHAEQGSRTARHLEEVSLLWARMLERLEEEAPAASTLERMRWLRRAERFLQRAPYIGARAYAKARLDALLGTMPITVLLPARAAADLEPVVTAVAAAGGRLARMAVIDRTESAAAALSLAKHSRLHDAPIMRLSETTVRNDRSALLFEAAALDAYILAFLDPAALPATEALRDGFLAVAAEEADAWLPRIESSAAMLPPDLCGTVLNRRALEIATSAQGESPMTALGRKARQAGSIALPAEAAPAAPRPPLSRLEPGVPPIMARPAHSGRPTLLMLVHGWGGGTIRYAATLAAQIGAHVNLLYGWAVDNTRFYLSSLGLDIPELEIDLGDGVDRLIAAVRHLNPDRIDVIHSIGFDDLLEDFLDGLGLPFDITFTDYHHLAREPHVLNAEGIFVGDDALLRRDHPLRRPGPPRLALRAAERRIACSRDLAARIGRLAPGLDIIPARLPEPGNPRAFALHGPPLAEGETMRVLYLGRLTKNKGLRLIEGVGRLIAERRLNLRIDCLGADDSFPIGPEQGPHGIRLLGSYRQEELNPLICRLRPHLAWLPFTGPESHSYALSDAMLQGLPILATGIGAVAERWPAAPAAGCCFRRRRPWRASPPGWRVCRTIGSKRRHAGCRRSICPRSPKASTNATISVPCSRPPERSIGSRLGPDQPVHGLDVGEDDPDHLGRDGRGLVVGNAPRPARHDAIARAAHGVQHQVGYEGRHDQGAGIHPLRSLMGVTQHHRGKVEQRGFFGKCAAIRENAMSLGLEMHVVSEAQRRQEPQQRRYFPERLFRQTLARPRVGGNDHRQALRFSQSVETGEQRVEPRRIIDVLLPMRAGNEIAPALQPQSGENVGGRDFGAEMVQHLRQMGADLEDPIGWKSFGQQIAARVFRQRHVHVAQMVDDFAIQLFRHALIEAAIARLHVENGNLASLGGNDSEARVRVTIDENRLRPLPLQHGVGRGQHPRDGVDRMLAGGIEEVVGAADAEILEEHLVQLIVVILAGMYQQMIGQTVQTFDDPAHLDQLGPRAQDGHDLAHQKDSAAASPRSSRWMKSRLRSSSITPSSSRRRAFWLV
jgi:hypothetical protein